MADITHPPRSWETGAGVTNQPTTELGDPETAKRNTKGRRQIVSFTADNTRVAREEVSLTPPDTPGAVGVRGDSRLRKHLRDVMTKRMMGRIRKVSPPAGSQAAGQAGTCVSVKPLKPGVGVRAGSSAPVPAVHCVKRARRHRWKCEQVTFCGADEQLCHLWLQTLREQLDKLTCRPKRLLVFINPFGGKGQGLRIYERKVAPLFALAAISTEVIVTERANHAKEALYEMSVDSYDGLCATWDHGSRSRSRCWDGAGRPPPELLDRPPQAFLGASLPAEELVGSTDCVCYSTVGINDAKTSALHIIVGRSRPSLWVGPAHHWSTDCVCYSTVGINDAKTSALHIIVGGPSPLLPGGRALATHHRGGPSGQGTELLDRPPQAFLGASLPAEELVGGVARPLGISDEFTSLFPTFILWGPQIVCVTPPSASTTQRPRPCTSSWGAGGQWRAVHHHGALLRYSVSLLGYGFYGDIIKDSEKKRWMGLIRYDFSAARAEASGLLCSRCFVCRQSKQQLEEEQKRSLYGLEGSEEVEEWKVICGKFLAINAANMSCACPRSPRGLSPAAHLGDGSSDLILIRKCSRFNFLRFLVRHTNQGDQFDFTFVEVYRIKKFQFVSKQVEDEDSDLGERGKPGLRQICSQHPSCCCSAASSSPGVAHPVGAAVLTLGTRQVSITVTGL
ncbi:PREDICTED: ceramide kinase [Myotis brandtii]|uniref:ceramide kinase n=1 Tax=Myotis brandtii TaxID=109478 RepID=UPI00070400D7|nr:PREDICTED: ceramide kinase [Myotis brandtii]